jgi:hypothetical protein
MILRVGKLFSRFRLLKCFASGLLLLTAMSRQIKAAQPPYVPLAAEPPALGEMLIHEIYKTWRDTADQDYIAARGSYRAELWGPFLWSGLQAVEKYFKAILLLAGYPTIRFGHTLPSLFTEACKAVPALKQMEPLDVEFLTHLHIHGLNRYMSHQQVRNQFDLLYLDRVVRRLRMYCKASAWIADEARKPMTCQSLPTLPKKLWEAICADSIPGGYLERVLAGKHTKRQREILVWHNALYCSRPGRKLRKVKLSWGFRNSRVGLSAEQLAWLDARVKK